MTSSVGGCFFACVLRRHFYFSLAFEISAILVPGFAFKWPWIASTRLYDKDAKQATPRHAKSSPDMIVW